MADPYMWKKRIQRSVNRASGGRLIVGGPSKHGLSDIDDLLRLCRDIRTVIDVGANTGQTAMRFRAALPNARILSMEPVSETYEALRKRTDGLDIEYYKIALGTDNGTAQIFLTDSSFTSSMIEPPAQFLNGTELVEVRSIDSLVEIDLIVGPDSIDVLKIDAEGYDIQVLEGARKTLAAGRVRFILIEAGFHPGDPRHPLFDNIRDFLIPYGFRTVGFYEQTLEPTGEPSLRFANVLFYRQPT